MAGDRCQSSSAIKEGKGTAGRTLSFISGSLEFVGRRFKDSSLGKERRASEEILRQNHPQKIYAVVGPEGGFTEEEVALAKDKGFVPVKLGQRILRTETAAITLVGILQYELGDLNLRLNIMMFRTFWSFDEINDPNGS